MQSPEIVRCLISNLGAFEEALRGHSSIGTDLGTEGLQDIREIWELVDSRDRSGLRIVDLK